MFTKDQGLENKATTFDLISSWLKLVTVAIRSVEGRNTTSFTSSEFDMPQKGCSVDGPRDKSDRRRISMLHATKTKSAYNVTLSEMYTLNTLAPRCHVIHMGF